MVSKTSATSTAKPSTAPVAKKSVSKSAPKKTSSVAAKTTKTKIATPKAPAKSSVAPVEKVLEIKAKNEDKKVVAKSVKQPAPKAVKPVVESKESCACCTGKCKCEMCASWTRAYRNMFNFKGRTSRFEFWGFTLLNFFFAVLMCCALVALISSVGNNTLVATSLGALAAFILIEIITYLALWVRRLHDTGNSAWKGFFRPIILFGVLFIVMAGGCAYLISELGDKLYSEALDVTTSLGIVSFIVLFFLIVIFILYYLAKIFVTAGFFEEDEDNKYGVACYNDRLHRVKAFKYVAIYFTVVSFLNMIMSQLINFFGYSY